MSVFVIRDVLSEDGSVDAVEAPTAQAALDMLVGGGPYAWATIPDGWELTAPRLITSQDVDGSSFEAQVWGPF